MKVAYYSASIAEFLRIPLETVLGHLAASHAHDLTPSQRNAWVEQVGILHRELKDFAGGWVALEFAIPRIGKRADAIVLLGGVVFVLEFKVGTDRFDRSAIDQAVDYALDLKNFHSGSHGLRIVPIVAATRAQEYSNKLVWDIDQVAHPLLTNGGGIAELLSHIVESCRSETPVDPELWANSGYKPTPTIIEAAQALYRNHNVAEITRSDAGAKNLDATTRCLSTIIEKSKIDREKSICFVTGVPGAGKTLAGLNLITQRTRAHKDEHAVFLSGNGPLVEVLREALARDEVAQSQEKGLSISKKDAARKVASFVQNIHHFRDDNLRSTNAPIERVVVFDEAQRAWDLKQVAKFMKEKKGRDFDMSESEFLVSVMDRHADWCTIVCLVGGGQEINVGEGGLPEWFDAIKKRFSHWRVYTSSVLGHRDYSRGESSKDMLAGLNSHSMDALHLATSIRSFRAEKLSDFVGAVIAGDAETAREIYEGIKENYPFVLTRALEEARLWLRTRARGTERIGLVASSGASRLKPVGVNVHEKIDARYWFLNDREDVRSSFYLEDPATEFDIQGLEIDWACVCWEADLRYANGRWTHHRFRGTAWHNVLSAANQTYLSNAYRVLLTRARQGLVIYLPRGDTNDATRKPEWYEETADFLQRCGLRFI